MSTLCKRLWHGGRRACTPSQKTGCGHLRTKREAIPTGPRPSCNDLSGRQPQQPVYQTHRLAHLPPHVSTLIKSLGVDAKVVQELMRHASFRTTVDSYTQALDEAKRQAQERLADLIMQTGKVGHA
jgi:hypothetical protein